MSRLACWIGRVREHAWVAQGGTGKGNPWALCCLPPPVPPATPGAAGAPADSEPPSAPPELREPQRSWPGLDQLGAIQAGGGLLLGLIALFSSYDYITAFGRSIGLQQQWGIPLIAASVATVVVDAQLATGSRLRAAQDAERMADEAARERNLAREERQRADRSENEANRERNQADQERNRAAEARERQAETAERQRQSLAELRRSALLSARVQLDPSPTNRDRSRTFITLMGQKTLEDWDAGMA